MYTCSIPTTYTAEIESVSLVAYMNTTGGTSQSGSLLLSTSTTPCESYVSYPFTVCGTEILGEVLTTNPSTGSAWEWTDFENFSIGLKMGNATIEGETRCTRYYVKVTYTEEDYTDTYTVTQVYAQVYYTPNDSTCTLTSPTDIEAYHSRDSNAINFWNGDREVYDICRSGKGIMLSGDEYEGDEEHSSTPCERITCIRDMGRDGNLVEIDGLGSLYDGTYRIKSFGWNKISEQPEYYTWQLELEVED
jgi:hypothetical protein